MSLMDSVTESTISTESSDSESQSSDEINNLANQSMTGESTESKESKTESSWYYDDNTPGVGERPEWLQPKFKTVADAAKSFNELEKKFGKFKGAPEEYNLEIPELPDFKFEEGDPVLDEFLTFAKESNASQDFVTKALGHYVKAQQFNAPDAEAEIEKLGANASNEISALNEWASNRLDENEYNTFKSLITTAESFRVIQKLRRVSTSTPEIAVTKNSTVEKHTSERELMELIGDERFNKDPLFRAEVEKKAAKVWG